MPIISELYIVKNVLNICKSRLENGPQQFEN